MTKLEAGRHFLARKNGKLTEIELNILKNNEWLKILWLKENTDDLNIENYEKIEKISPLDTLKYVCQTLEVLENEKENLLRSEFLLLEEVLCYCEVAKGGTAAMRKKWRDKHFALYVHNISSAQIFYDINKDIYEPEYLNYVSTLIATHGLIGQYIRGETLLSSSDNLVGLHYLDVNHEKVIKVLNKCIIGGVSMELYDNIKHPRPRSCSAPGRRGRRHRSLPRICSASRSPESWGPARGSISRRYPGTAGFPW